MADDSVSQPSDPNAVSAPVSPQDQTTPNADIGQQPAGTWPNSTNLANTQSPANSSSSNLANLPAEADASAKVGDQQATQSAEPVVPQPPKEEIPPQAPAPEIGQVAETKPDEPVVSADLSAEVSTKADSPTTISPADVPVTSSPSPLPSEAPAEEGVSPTLPSSPTDTPPVTTPETPPPEVATPEPSEAVKPLEEKVDINVQSSDDQALQVPPEVPKYTPAIDIEKPPEDLATFKPEPSESPQEAPLANTDSGVSPQKSFGDLLSSEDQAPSTPSIPPIPSPPPVPSTSSTPVPISFGDLIKDIKPEESVIPPLSVPPIPSIPQISSFPSSPPSPVSPSSDQLSLRRQKANQVRSQKKAKHLSKIMELAKNTKSISNTDIQRLLRVSQSTATNYLSELVNRGILKRQGIRGGAKYTL